MWCSNCQQDVPGLGSASGGALRCGKCGVETMVAPSQPATESGCSAEFAHAIPQADAFAKRILHLPALGNDDWALEAELRGVQRLVASLKSHEHQRPLIPESQAEPDSTSSRISTPAAARPQPRSNALGWLILSLGLAVFACGAVLLAWSLIGQREDLWPIGMPLTLIGQAGLILGLVLQLDGLWNTSRMAAAALSELDGELKNVRQATTLLSTSHSGGAQSFYLHLAEGASPNLLLADLKGQMDQLAQQLAQKA